MKFYKRLYLDSDKKVKINRDIEFIVATDFHYIAKNANLNGELDKIC